jgi:hypothetical protein
VRTVAGLSRIQLGLLALSVVIVVAVVAVNAMWSGDDDPQVASATSTERRPVKVIIAGTNDAKEPGGVTDGSIVGEGTFRASGAITDHGTVRAHRWVMGDETTGVKIALRFITKGQKGAVTYVVRIDTARRPVISRWTIESGTQAYKGLQGKGIETENATFTVSTLRGKVWR